MSAEELRQELEQARDAYNQAQIENERLIDERESVIEKIQLECDKKITALEAKYEEELLETKRNAEYQLETITKELDMFRRAASGDACGWEEKADGSFQNKETNEISTTDMPAVLSLALAVRRTDDAKIHLEAKKQAERNARISETKRRQLEVELNEARSGAASQRELLIQWGDAAAFVHGAVVACHRSFAATCDKLDQAGLQLEAKAGRISSGMSNVQCVNFKSRLKVAVKAFRTQKRVLSDTQAMGRKLETKICGLETNLGLANTELSQLRTSIHQAVEVEVQPMRTEIALARDDLSREKLLRLVERQQFAALWPQGHLAPRALRRHMPLDENQRAKLKSEALLAEADADVKREIRRRVADATRWSQVTDDYGRQYYAHSDTGEASWEPPEAMMYEPPPGRDALGNVVISDELKEEQTTVRQAAAQRDANSINERLSEESVQARSLDTSHSAQRHKDPWIQVTDDWGQSVWKNSITGEIVKHKPAGKVSKDRGDGNVMLDQDTLMHDASRVAGEEVSKEPESDFSSEDDERDPTTGDGAAFFIARLTERQQRSKQRRERAMMAARRAIGFLEEEAHRILKYRAKVMARKEADFDADTPIHVDMQAIRELAAGEEGWTYIVHEKRKELEAQAKAARLKAELEAQAVEAARKAEIQRTLEERRKATGLSKLFKKSIHDPPNSSKIVEHNIRKGNLSGQEEELAHKAQMRSHQLGCDAYYTLIGAADGFDDADERAVDALRLELEATARQEEKILSDLAKTRRRLEAISLRVLKCNRHDKGTEARCLADFEIWKSKSHYESESAPAAPNDYQSLQIISCPIKSVDITKTEIAVHKQMTRTFRSAMRKAREQLHDMRDAVTSAVEPASESMAGFSQDLKILRGDSPFRARADGMLPPPASPYQNGTMRAVHKLAAEMVWAGLNGVELQESEVCAQLRALGDETCSEAIDWLSITFFTRGTNAQLELMSRNAVSFELKHRLKTIEQQLQAPERSIVRSIAAPSARLVEAHGAAMNEASAVGAVAALACCHVAAALVKHGSSCSTSSSRSATIIESVDGLDVSRAQVALLSARRFAMTAKLSPEFDEAIQVVRNNRLVQKVIDVHQEHAKGGILPRECHIRSQQLGDTNVSQTEHPGSIESNQSPYNVSDKIAEAVDQSHYHEKKVSELLELGSENQLPKQIAALALGTHGKNNTENGAHELHEAESFELTVVDEAEAPAYTGKRLDSVEEARAPAPAPAPATSPFDSTKASPQHGVHDATMLLAEASYGHEIALSSLIRQAAQLGMSAWVKHEREVDRLVKLLDDLQACNRQRNLTLMEVRGRVADLEGRIEAARRVVGAQFKIEDSKEYAKLRQCKVDAARLQIEANRQSEEIYHVSDELDAERERGAWLRSSATYATSVRAAQKHERERQGRALVLLQDSLMTVCEENGRAGLELQSGDATVALEVQAASCIAIVRIRERLREEGRRRRWLREEELSFFRAETRRIAEEKATEDERLLMLQLIAAARAQCDSAVDALHAEIVAITAAENWRIGITSCRVELESRVAAAYSQLALVELSRRIARQREQRHRQETFALTRAAAKVAAPLPVVDDGNPTSEISDSGVVHPNSTDLATVDSLTATALLRLNDAKKDEKPGIEGSWTTTASFLELALQDVSKAWESASRFAANAENEANRRLHEQEASSATIAKLQAQLLNERRLAMNRQHEAVASGVRASASIKKLAVQAKEQSHSERAAAQRDSLRDMHRRDVIEEKMRTELESTKRQSHISIARAETMRYCLGLETARRRISDKKVLSLTEQLATLRGRCNDEIRAERAHSARIELWVYAMLSSFAYLKDEIAHRERLLNMQENLDKKAQRRFKHELWRQATAAQTLGLDVDALILYFAQRMASLSGAHCTFNNALRANGAPLVLAAMCQSPRHEIRRLGAKALAALSWDGHVDSRILGAGVREQWRLWVTVAVNREEESIRRELAALNGAGDQRQPYIEPVEASEMVSKRCREPVHPEDKVPARTFSERQILRGAMEIPEGDIELERSIAFRRLPTTPEQVFGKNARDVAVARRQWALRRQRVFEGPNRANMRIIAAPVPTNTAAWLGIRALEGSVARIKRNVHRLGNSREYESTCSQSQVPMTPPLVSTLLTLAYDRDQDCVLAAASGIAAASFDTDNALTLGRNNEIVKAVVFLAKHENLEAAANLTFQQQANQEAFGKAGLIEILVALLSGGSIAGVAECNERMSNQARKKSNLAEAEEETAFAVCANKDGTESPFDTDVAEAATCALANMISLHSPNSARLAVAGGVSTLLGIINSPLTVNLLDVDQTVEIQTNAINALANAAASVGEEGRQVVVEAVEAAMQNDGQKHSRIGLDKPVTNKPSAKSRDNSPLAALVLLCTSELVAAQTAAALLLGNLARDIVLQDDLGRLGAIEALWGISRDAVNATQKTTALWAMSNLVWANRANQDRCHYLLEGLIVTAGASELEVRAREINRRPQISCITIDAQDRSPSQNIVARQWFAARVCAVNIIANAMHYHDKNRHLVEVIPNGIEVLLGLSLPRHDGEMREAALRCLVNITSTDRGARSILRARDVYGGMSACAILVLAAGDANAGGASCSIRKFAAAALANVSTVQEARSQVREAGGVGALVALAGSADELERNEANAALAALENNIERSVRKRKNAVIKLRPSAGRLGATALVSLLKASPGDESSVNERAELTARQGDSFAAEHATDTAASAEWARQMAADTLTDSEWLKPENLKDIVELGGIDALFATLGEYRDVLKHSKLLVSTVIGIYDCAYASQGNMGVCERVAALRGIQTLISVGRAAYSCAPMVLEATLRALVPLTTNNTPNCRTLMSVGLDFLLDIVEDQRQSNTGSDGNCGEAARIKDNANSRSLAATLLHILSPHNSIVCLNCSTANRAGLVCVYCGHSLIAGESVSRENT